MYVWVDALTNYLTGVGFPDTDSESFAQVLARGSAHDRQGHHPVPHRVLAGVPDVGGNRVAAKGFRARLPLRQGREDEQVGGQRRRPDRTRRRSSALDQVRYFLLREVPFGQDGSYSEDAIITRINADLANELGNLAQRSLSMVTKNLDGDVPQPGEFTDDDRALLAAPTELLPTVRAHFDVPAMHLALEAIWLMLGEANRYFSAQEPWVLRKSEAEADQERFRTVLYTTLEVVRIAALLVQPVMPDSAAKMLDLLGQPEDQRELRRDRRAARAGHRLARRRRASSPATRCDGSAVGRTDHVE